MAILDVQKSLLTISDQYHNFYFCDFWMSKTHFRWHFWSFQINTKLFFQNIFTKWPLAPILDVRNSLLIAFLAISDRYATLICLEIFDKMAAVGHFGCPKFTFDRISGHFRSIRNFNFDKMGAVGHFGCPKFTFDRISGHFRSIRNFIFFGNFWTKWLLSAILDVRNSLSIAFLAIFYQYATLILTKWVPSDILDVRN